MPSRVMLATKVLADPQKRMTALQPSKSKAVAGAMAAGAGHFDYSVQLVGATPDGKVTVYYDNSLGAQALEVAKHILGTAAQTYATCSGFFGLAGGPVNVIIAELYGSTDGSGGAYHNGCDFQSGGDLYCDVAFGAPEKTNGLVVAELTEAFMGAQGKGWGCGDSNGEALSRVLAEALSGGPGGVLADYASAPAWDQNGRPNWIDTTESTDRNLSSTGCGVLYLYWLMSLGHSATKITQAGCPNGTLASNYKVLTGKTSAWADFSQAVAGLATPISSDNPWSTVMAANKSFAPVTKQEPGQHLSA